MSIRSTTVRHPGVGYVARTRSRRHRRQAESHASAGRMITRPLCVVEIDAPEYLSYARTSTLTRTLGLSRAHRHLQVWSTATSLHVKKWLSAACCRRVTVRTAAGATRSWHAPRTRSRQRPRGREYRSGAKQATRQVGIEQELRRQTLTPG